MSYFIYRLTSPSGKVYVGISKNPTVRFSSHKKRARNRTKRHPLYDAMHAHGPDNFTMAILSEHADEFEALQEEISQIAAHRATDRLRGYNVSPGGQYDGAAGAAVFWTTVKSDVAAYDQYIERLSEGCKKRGETNLKALLASQALLSPRDRWYRAYRACRVAARDTRGLSAGKARPNQKEPEAVRKMSEACRASWTAWPASKKKRHGIKSRVNAYALWSRRTDTEIAELAAAISGTLKKRYATDPEFSARNSTQLKTARASINRSVQAPAASRGLKGFWAALKLDPVRYEEYLTARTKSLISTIAKKAALCKK